MAFAEATFDWGHLIGAGSLGAILTFIAGITTWWFKVKDQSNTLNQKRRKDDMEADKQKAKDDLEREAAQAEFERKRAQEEYEDSKLRKTDAYQEMAKIVDQLREESAWKKEQIIALRKEHEECVQTASKQAGQITCLLTVNGFLEDRVKALERTQLEHTSMNAITVLHQAAQAAATTVQNTADAAAKKILQEAEEKKAAEEALVNERIVQYKKKNDEQIALVQKEMEKSGTLPPSDPTVHENKIVEIKAVGTIHEVAPKEEGK